MDGPTLGRLGHGPDLSLQYRDSRNLAVRARLHRRYGTATVGWSEWMAGQGDWPDAGEVLEVGCGAGWLWDGGRARLPRSLRLVLTDRSPGMLAEARGRAGGTGHYAAVGSAVADVQALPFAADRFDTAVANHMLYHVPDRAAVVRELARVLDPDGMLLASTNGRRNLAVLWAIRREVLGTPVPPPHVQAFGAENGAALLGTAFGDVSWVAYPDELVCTSRDDVVAYLLSTTPALDAAAPARAALARAVDARFDAAGGVLRVEKQTGVFRCRRPR